MRFETVKSDIDEINLLCYDPLPTELKTSIYYQVLYFTVYLFNYD